MVILRVLKFVTPKNLTPPPPRTRRLNLKTTQTNQPTNQSINQAAKEEAKEMKMKKNKLENEEEKREGVKKRVEEGVKERVKEPEGRAARQETVLSPRDRAARPITETVLSPLARTARPGMVLSPPVRTTPQLRWKREWQERFGAVDGIAPASNIFDFRCLLCQKDYHIGTKGLASVTRHILQHNHQKMRVNACDRLKEKILLF
jgi:hypothetical protein